jgi:OOP family OmpA-OmpF porin
MLLGNKLRSSAVTALLVTGTAAPAFAQTGFYVGAIAGSSVFHKNKGDFDTTVVDAFNSEGLSVVSGSSTLDKSDFGFGALVGYRFIPAFAVEAGYIDLGKLTYRSSGMVTDGFSPAVPATADITAKAKGPTLAGVGFLPLSPAWDLYGKAGVLFSKVTLDVNIVVGSGAGEESVSGNSVDPLVGFGAAWHVADAVALRAEYTRFFDVGDKNKTGEANVDLFSLGITYSFH